MMESGVSGFILRRATERPLWRCWGLRPADKAITLGNAAGTQTAHEICDWGNAEDTALT